MAKTLYDLHTMCREIASKYTSEHIPFMMNGKPVDITLEDKGNNGNYYVEVKIASKPQ